MKGYKLSLILFYVDQTNFSYHKKQADHNHCKLVNIAKDSDSLRGKQVEREKYIYQHKDNSLDEDHI